MSVNLAYYIEIPRRDTERFGRTGECASAVIRFVFAVAIAGENHFFPHPDSAKVLLHWENLKYSAFDSLSDSRWDHSFSLSLGIAGTGGRERQVYFAGLYRQLS